MEWQDLIVAVVGIGVAVYLLRRLFCGRKRSNGCASCSKECPVRDLLRKKE